MYSQLKTKCRRKFFKVDFLFSVPTKVKKTSSSVNVGLAVGLCFGILVLITCLIVGKLWYRRSRHAKKVNLYAVYMGV